MPQVLALVDDLMFLSRIREAGSGVGVEIRSVRRPQQVTDGVRQGARLLIVDADSDRLPWAEAVSKLGTEGLLDTTTVVAFHSHVNTDRGEAARAAGCRVTTRGAFVNELPALLAAVAGPPTPTEETKP